MTRSPSVRYFQILTFSENRLLVPAFSSTADGQRGTPRRPSADGVTRLPSPLPYVFHLQGIAPKLLTHSPAFAAAKVVSEIKSAPRRGALSVRIGAPAQGAPCVSVAALRRRVGGLTWEACPCRRRRRRPPAAPPPEARRCALRGSAPCRRCWPRSPAPNGSPWPGR